MGYEYTGSAVVTNNADAEVFVYWAPTINGVIGHEIAVLLDHGTWQVELEPNELNDGSIVLGPGESAQFTASSPSATAPEDVAGWGVDPVIAEWNEAFPGCGRWPDRPV